MRDGEVVSTGGAILVPRVWLADNPFDRLRGLLGRPPLEAGEGLWLQPCGSVHTIGMSYALDLAFISAEGTVLKLVHALPPFRSAGCRGARTTLEMSDLAASGIEEGMQVAWRAR